MSQQFEQSIDPLAPQSKASGGPAIAELLILGLLLLVSFRFVGLLVIGLAAIVFGRTSRSLPRNLSMALIAISFLQPIDFRWSTSKTHFGDASQCLAIVPVFRGCLTSHSHIRKTYAEYYTSLIINPPSWVVSIAPERW